jgi:hypothetical protein
MYPGPVAGDTVGFHRGILSRRFENQLVRMILSRAVAICASSSAGFGEQKDSRNPLAISLTAYPPFSYCANVSGPKASEADSRPGARSSCRLTGKLDASLQKECIRGYCGLVPTLGEPILGTNYRDVKEV